MTTQVTHQGRVTRVADSFITVNIKPTESECGGCAISKLCSKSEDIDVPMRSPSPDLLGKQVTIGIASNAQRMATVVFFVAPLVLLLGVLVLCLLCFDVSEAMASVISIAIVALYYILVWRLHDRFKTQIKVLSINS